MNNLATNLPDGARSLDLSPAQITARMMQFCEWFGVEPVKLRVRKGQVYMTDELVAWCTKNEVSIDWLFRGDLRPVMAAHRRWVTLMKVLKLQDQAGKANTPATMA